MYRRVIPRDLFNEAKLLKCIGALVVLVDPAIGTEEGWEIEYDGMPFKIQQDPDGGELYIENLQFFYQGHPVYYGTKYNSKEVYPLVDRWRGGYILDDEGKINKEWIHEFTEGGVDE